MPPRKKTPPAASKAPAKHFIFHLTLSGVAGIALATFCLFLWMFFLGMWAGRTIISPCPSVPLEKQAQLETTLTVTDTDTYTDTTDSSAICVQPRERKKRISSREPSIYQGP
ncbi:hypothetical protein VU10_07245 [Desulfobulbus sp. US1]|nr:hypothetical protein [Desulfobulbus sp. US4]MCW5209951.1 hypothetical protein [Desulfobulbus sp. US1]WLE95145.1 MAG: hypothetical protein QTN59_10615 [Candidatus Electrothrix communis]